MRRLALLLLLAACGSSAAPVAEPPSTTSAPTIDAAPAPAPVAFEGGRIVVRGPADEATIRAALAAVETGDVAVELADVARYEDLVAVIDAAVAAGIDAYVSVPDRDDWKSAATGRRTFDPSIEETPVLIISATDVRLGPIVIATIAELAADPGPDLAGLEAELAKLDPVPSMMVLQADRATTGEVLNRAMRAAKDSGIQKFLFAVKVK